MFPWARDRDKRTAQENKAAIHRVNVELWQGNLAILDELTAPGFYDRIAGASSGIEQTKRDVAAVLAAFPDLQLTGQDLIAENDTVAAQSFLRGPPQNQLFAIPP
ncbi:MAG: ester cyclase, partial [Chloroflexi bacterium]|nr:ester cyclase [Chloroflexota bacterium]